MGRTLLSVFVGVIAEILVFVLLIPNDSTKPPTLFQSALVHMLFPMMSIKDTLGPIANALPYPLSAVSGFLILGLGFLLQAAVFGLPVWIGAFLLSRLGIGNLRSFSK